jgi:hypothetical protein
VGGGNVAGSSADSARGASGVGKRAGVSIREDDSVDRRGGAGGVVAKVDGVGVVSPDVDSGIGIAGDGDELDVSGFEVPGRVAAESGEVVSNEVLDRAVVDLDIIAGLAGQVEMGGDGGHRACDGNIAGIRIDGIEHGVVADALDDDVAGSLFRRRHPVG